MLKISIIRNISTICTGTAQIAAIEVVMLRFITELTKTE